jgi:hypothetical protein
MEIQDENLTEEQERVRSSPEMQDEMLGLLNYCRAKSFSEISAEQAQAYIDAERQRNCRGQSCCDPWWNAALDEYRRRLKLEEAAASAQKDGSEVAL